MGLRYCARHTGTRHNMSASEIPTSSVLFSLYPCNEEARKIVRENEPYLGSICDGDCLSVEIQHKSKQDGKLLSLGYGISSNDIILCDPDYGGFDSRLQLYLFISTNKNIFPANNVSLHTAQTGSSSCKTTRPTIAQSYTGTEKKAS